MTFRRRLDIDSRNASVEEHFSISGHHVFAEVVAITPHDDNGLEGTSVICISTISRALIDQGRARVVDDLAEQIEIMVPERGTKVIFMLTHEGEQHREISFAIKTCGEKFRKLGFQLGFVRMKSLISIAAVQIKSWRCDLRQLTDIDGFEVYSAFAYCSM